MCVCVCVCVHVRACVHKKKTDDPRTEEFSVREPAATDLISGAREVGLEAGGVDERACQRPIDVDHGAVVGGLVPVVGHHIFEARA